jgi:hypothetical protein
MAERPLYARLGLLIVWLSLLPASTWGQVPSTAPACAACLAVRIAPGQALLLPDQLHGLTILLDATGGAIAPVIRAAELVALRGGRPGLLVRAMNAGSPTAEHLYELRLRLTALRSAAGDGLLIALETSPGTPLGAYADVLVGPTREDVPAGVRYWPLLLETDLAAALARTAAGGAEQWVLAAPADVIAARALLHGLAQAAAPPPGVLTDSVEVRGARRLTADEIVARHQAFARLQASRVTRTILTGTTTLTFEAPGFPAPVTITSDTVVFEAPGQVEVEQRSIAVNGIAFAGGRVPKLPIIEPERVAAPPLAITLSDAYRYRLAGEASIDGVRCYVVRFDPASSDASLFRGTAWIGVDTFAMVRVAAAQTRLRGAIVSSEQVDDFREIRPGIWLLARSDVRQLYEGAAHRTPIHRLVTIGSHEIDPGDFEARLQAAYASSSVMLRDTPEGYRYLERETRADPARPASPPEVVVEVAKRSTRMRTLAAGVIIDPNISVPLPFAGFSYVDFDLLGTGAQLSAFFGGSYAQVALSAPSLGGTRWQLGGRAFGIASSYNDRSFREGVEIYGENLRQRPAHASAWLLRPLSPRLTFRAGYEFDYTRLGSAPETAADFVVPADQVVHGARLGIEGQRAGWAGSLWWNPARRAGWQAWGRTAEAYSPAHATFHRYGATVSRSAAPSPRLVTRVEAAIMGGSDLDRFSRYAFGTFDNRLRGYPSALVRYDRGGVVRGAVAWSAARVVRLDGFLDVAFVRDRGFGRGVRNYTGVGFAAEAPAPFGLLAAVEWGYGFRGLNADGGRGTHVVRVSAYKMF